MSALQKVIVIVLVALLALTGYGLWATYQPASGRPRHGRSGHPAEVVAGIDQATLLGAQRLSQLATSDDEKTIAASAVQLADHELDVAFSAALRQIEAHPPQLGTDAQAIENRLQKSQRLLETDQASVDQLTASLTSGSGSQRSSTQDQLELAKSQVELDKDEVEEANQDLLDAGGNLHQRIQQMMQQHSATEQKVAAPAPRTPDPLANLRGLARRVGRWFDLRDRQRDVDDARQQVLDSVDQLGADRQSMAARLEQSKGGVPQLAQHTKRAKTDGQGGGAAAPGTSIATTANAAGLLSTTRQIAADQRLLTLLDERIADRKELSDIYAKWSALLGGRMRTVLHASLVSVATVIGIVLAVLVLNGWLDRLFNRAKLDRRQVGTLRGVTRMGLQVLGLVVILIVLVGVPTQIGTILGIVGAGLTVALKDFIVAFLGWLSLMGKNGIRLGDWVEINGVSGEVVDIGMFHSVLLETGSWTEAGHPTGRRVTFANSFAIQGHYFNFSTSGQWLWDELLVLVPYERDPHAIADAIHKEVLAATTETTHEAELEWQRAVKGQTQGSFSAAPGLIIRPAYGGVEVVVRYVTRASDRFALRARLYQAAVQLLGVPNRAGLPASSTPAGQGTSASA
ncbi:MAG TPA: mechanosensitive ion channel domain-containing protein [Steroidobacteraceae bacterium]|jgi:hypothetical protein